MSQPGSGDIQTISMEQLLERMSENTDIKVVNVLEDKYYDDCHISGSIHAPLASIEQHVSDWDKNDEIVVYCAKRECSASRDAYKKMKALGFTNVKAYEGGTKEWRDNDRLVEGSCAMDYLKN